MPDYGDEINIEDEQAYGSSREQFANPGGRSALRAATGTNPRNQPCPTCKKPNKLTPADVRRHYQCDDCADREEGWGD